ncbi:hypothetical protein GOP47_0026093 [Adiantum capillus-veneris]|uniref:glutamate formimidoyltransferase n=1 Tax=Adiantum capillus-veneris TaxID=13818 RepID=A0A9D4Z4B3_ADICA|nr:hypothetical protein GOP47_0025640 [Adiantum capillus-veneris]KAI5059774.1 hypothetical protein GOP47_0026093 [Adiantum capillus-veneris]
MKAGVAKEALASCKLYISESRNQKALDAIAAAAAVHSRQAPLLNTFPDQHYNRVGYTLAGALPPYPEQKSPLKAAVLDMVAAALSHIDLQQHVGSHPRLGVIDHICFHPLRSASLPVVASLACNVASHISSQFAVPTFVYGAAHQDNRPLAAIRRALGYFSPNTEGQWAGYAISQQLGLVADFGPNIASQKSGVVVVGACPWIANYNIPILSNNLKLGRRIAKNVSSRGGGLPACQAMALLHGMNRMEIACNLTDLKQTTAEMVQEEVRRLAESEGLSTLCGYFTDLSEAQITDMAYKKLFEDEAY